MVIGPSKQLLWFRLAVFLQEMQRRLRLRLLIWPGTAAPLQFAEEVI